MCPNLRELNHVFPCHYLTIFGTAHRAPFLVLLGKFDRQFLDAIVAQVESAKIRLRVEKRLWNILDVVLAEKDVRQVLAVP